jgi:hypothetical protein
MVSMARAERNLPREPLEGHSAREVIEILRYASEGTSLALYNAQDTLTNNLLKASGLYIPDTIQEAVDMRHKVMDLMAHVTSRII